MDVRATGRGSSLIYIDDVAYDVSNLLIPSKDSTQGEKLYPTDQLSAFDEGVYCERRRAVDYRQTGLRSKKPRVKRRKASSNNRVHSDGLPGAVTLKKSLKNQASEAVGALIDANGDGMCENTEEMKVTTGKESISDTNEYPDKQRCTIALEQSPMSQRSPLTTEGLGSKLDPRGQNLL